MAKRERAVTFMSIMSEMERHHHYVLTMLYRVGAGKTDTGASEDYWRGALNGIEACLDALGVEYEKFSPLGFMEYEED